MGKDLKANLEFVTKNKKSLLEKYRNKFILVFNEQVVGSYDTYENAEREGVRLYGLDANFLVYYLAEKKPLNFIMEAAL